MDPRRNTDWKSVFPSKNEQLSRSNDSGGGEEGAGVAADADH